MKDDNKKETLARPRGWKPGDRPTNLTVLHVRERFDRVEDMLVKGWRPGEIYEELIKTYGISRRTARRCMAFVHARWAQESGLYDREAKRERMRATLWNVVRTALECKKHVVVYQGKDSPSVVQEYPEPDIKGATGALDLIARIDALATPDKNGAHLVIPERVISELQKYYGLTDVVEATPKKRDADTLPENTE